MYVIGTSGHVDHGKSRLVKALTGIDPDRLAEEKVRGMTIDLGFAWLRLPSGKEISIIDVPGHQQFIENMLAGVGAIDAVILVVAADDGIMPQTREHLDILNLLNVSKGVIALTKIDLVEPELCAIAIEEIRSLIESTSLKDTVIVPLSTLTGQGLDDFIAALDSSLDDTPRRPDLQRPRLWIDRIFTRPGFGTVVTGTLIDGMLHVGQEVVILPQGMVSRIRSMESHKQRINSAQPGTRVAVNLPGLAVSDLQRGNVLTIPNCLQPTKRLDVRLQCLASNQDNFPDGVSGRFYTGTFDCGVKVRLLDRDELLPGESAYAQLFLDNPVSIIRGDHFVIRRPAIRATSGGGIVLDPHPLRHNRFDAITLNNLLVMENGEPEEILLCVLGQKKPIPRPRLLQWSGFSPQELNRAIERIIEKKQAVLLSPDNETSPYCYVSSLAGWEYFLNRILELIDAYHRQYPLRPYMLKEELRSRLSLEDNLYRLALQQAVDSGKIKDFGSGVSLPQFHVSFTAQQQKQINALISAFRKAPTTPPTGEEVMKTMGIDAELLQALIYRGDLVAIGDDIYFLSDIYHDMIDRLVAYLQKYEKITVAQARDLFESSRRYTLALLNHLDQKITRRVGDERYLR
ncbi:MAG: selenocysteine-specific translation elongation factor [Chloroflexi bacterium]|nr:selenocysteine-specific translation elongation factor [Chloroflexota bacterium]